MQVNRELLKCNLTDALSQPVSSYVLRDPFMSCLVTAFIKQATPPEETEIVTLWKKTQIISRIFLNLFFVQKYRSYYKNAFIQIYV